MFDLDNWQEIFATMQKNKLRTFLTAFGVFWGIFILVMLLGFGKGLENGIKQDFEGEAVNNIWVWEGKTTLPHKGMQPGRTIRFTTDDLETINREVEGIDFLAPRNRVWGEYTLNYKDKNGAFQVFGSTADFFKLGGEWLKEGRLLNERDQAERRKVIVIGQRVKKVLFGDSTALGKYINVRGVYFQVVGIFRSNGNQGRNEERAYIPFNTCLITFNQKKDVQMFSMNALKTTTAADLEQGVRKVLAQKYKFSQEDKQAVGVYNNEENYNRLMGLFAGIRGFVWVVGIGTLIAGIVGVSNIMLIIVKERTREIGVRKALGATPFAIVSQILLESVSITAFAGYTGLLCGAALLEAISILLAQNSQEGGGGFFANPEIDFSVAISATILLVFAGAVAGLIPALKAASIKPIEALRAD